MIPQWIQQRRLAVPIESEIFTGINRIRLKYGRSILRWDEELLGAARAHSEAMRELGFCGHDSPIRGRETPAARALAAGAHFSGLGENVLFHERALAFHVGFLTWTLRSSALPASVRARTLVMQWWNSPPHRTNLLEPAWERSGVGIALMQSGRIYATQLFAN